MLVGLGVAARLGFGPAPGNLEWTSLDDPPIELSELERTVAEGVAREARARTPLASEERIDINRASIEDLRRLPGVGPSLAQAIVVERGRRPFESIESIERVAGIGPATRARLAPVIHVGLPATSHGLAASRTDGPSSSPGGTGTDLNRATAAELERLPGIGPTLARRILERRATAPYEAPTDLLDVSGIGPRSLTKLEGLVCARTP